MNFLFFIHSVLSALEIQDNCINWIGNYDYDWDVKEINSISTQSPVVQEFSHRLAMRCDIVY